MLLQEGKKRRQRDGSLVKITGSSSEGPMFNSQHSQESSWLEAILSREISCPLLDSMGTACKSAQAHAAYT